ncbi:sugar transferase [Alicyclobacillus herbarius]|uniref:sugar transferase n=1 Tax=Alicyclobacillus herbarius TaxID=122960 RepID=UPI00042520E2|nr:sugar transferase [Alicyclobacillus herbarius]
MLYLLDLALLYASVVLSFLLRFGTHWPTANWEAALHLLPYLLGLAALLSYLLDLNGGPRRKRMGEIVPILVFLNGALFVLCLALSFWTRQFALPRSIAVTACLVNLLLGVLLRGAWQRIKQRSLPRRAVLVCRSAGEGQALRRQLQSVSTPLFQELRIAAAGAEHLRPLEADTVILSPNLRWEDRQQMALTALESGQEVKVMPSAADLMLSRCSVEQLGDTLLLSMHPLGISAADALVKRVIDVLGALVLMLATAPISLLLFLLIPLTSPGPALYRQDRVGQNGRVFTIYKFRTMIPEAERTTGPVLAAAGDPRVTPFGRILRATRLDELPQLFNVLKGDMSLVGPRPERPEFVRQFEIRIAGYGLRHVVRPGLTGLAQVLGEYSTDAAEKLRYDLWYVRHYSPALDLKILLQTVFVVLRPSRARGVKTNPIPLDASVKS